MLKKLTDYQGQRKAKDMVDFVLPQVPNNVQAVGSKGKNSKSLEDFVLVDTNMPRALLISKKSTTSPLLKGISTEFKSRLVVGELRTSDTETLAKIEEHKKFESYPVLLIFPKGVNGPDGVVLYGGELKYKPLTAFLEKYALEKPKKKNGKDDKKPAKESKKSKSDPSPKTEEPFDPKIPEITNQLSLQNDCLNKPGVCVVTVSDVESEYEESTAAHAANLAVLEKIKKKYHEKNAGLQFAWVNGLKAPKPYFLTQFDIPDFHPALFIVNGKKGVYRIHRGSFDEHGIEGFLNEVLKGRGRNVKFAFEPVMEKAADNAKDEL
ncbi:hypothetical protein HDU84_000520 [Entophlyctis sp. JEL0112]|nr:hypothetical protein HDU84_000520 [Entophlyctis sp. JEL0112]